MQMDNPCRPGTFKWILCQAAIEHKTVEEAKAELDQLKKGAGDRLLEYKGDLRTENGLDIQVEDGHLVYRGRL